MKGAMELRHLRYFVAVAEEGNLTLAAKKRLHTAQPSLSRQIRDLEYEVGVQLMSRSVRGIELTAAGRVFLDHARLALAQVETAREAARRAAEPTKPSFALGFLTGQEMDWLPGAMRILHDELPNMQVTVASQYSPDLAQALMAGRLDVAFMRPEAGTAGLAYKLVTREPLVVVLPGDHRLASREAIHPRDVAGETFITVSSTAPALRRYRQLPEAIRSRRQPGSRSRQSRHGDVSDRFDAGRGVPACLRKELHAVGSGLPSAGGRSTNDRPSCRLQHGERIAHPEAIPVKIGRTDRWRIENAGRSWR